MDFLFRSIMSASFVEQVPVAEQLRSLTTLVQQELVRRGVLTRPVVFISSAHGEYDIDATVMGYSEALAVLKQAIESRTVEEQIDGDIIEPIIRAS